MSKKKIIIGSLVILVIVIIIIANVTGSNDNKSISVQVSDVERQKIVETVTATGRIQPKNQVKISADVAAKIIDLKVNEGDCIKKGDLLVQLDRERFIAAVESQQANMRSTESNALLAKENMLKAEKDYVRTKELFARKLESQAVLDQKYATNQVEKARYNSTLEMVAQVKASLKQAMDDLSKTTIYAPMSGTISELNKEIGEIALGSQFQEDVIMVISNLAGMEALVNVDENDIVSVTVGDSAKIEVDALPEKVFAGVVSEIASSATIIGSGSLDQKTEFKVKISIINPRIELKPGMTASSDIITEIRKNVIGVPIQCVTVRTLEQLKKKGSKAHKKTLEIDNLSEENFDPDKDGFVELVFVVVDGMAMIKQVKTGIQSETHIEIIEGLSENEKIVTGNYRVISQTLKDETPVVIEKKDEQK